MNSILSYGVVNLIPISGWWTLLGVVQYVPGFTLVPRFILSLRKLYARDLGGDTAFGLTSASSRGTIMFRDEGVE